MASRSMDVSVMVKLVDRVTGPLSALMRRFEQFAALGRRIGIMGAAVAAISFAVPLASAAAFDQQLRESAVTAGLFGTAANERIAMLGRSYSDLALKVGLLSSALADAGSQLVASGMDEALTERLMPTIGRVSKAATALPTDVAKVAFALNNSLKIGADQMEMAFAKLIIAGKLGRFEFRDMARELPELTAQFGKFGLKGMEAVETLGASLQVAMFGTDNTSAAANNFKNYLSKILSPEVVKNFAKKGFNVDILGVMQKAAAQGINPIEASIEKVLKLAGVSQNEALGIFRANKGKGMNDAEATAAAIEQITKIGGSGKLSKIFGDMQVLDFLLPMLANIDKYKEFKASIASSGLDVIARDFATQWEGLSTQMTVTEEIGTQALRRIGTGLGKNVPMLNEWGIAALRWVHGMDAAFPGLIDQVLSWGGAVLLGVAALAVLAPVIYVVSAAMGVLAGVLAIAAGAIALLLTPIGLVAAAVAGAAVLIYAKWDDFSSYFGDMWEGLKDIGGGAVRFFSNLFRGDWGGVAASFKRMWNGIKSLAGGLGGTLTGLGRLILKGITSAGGMVVDWLDQQLGTDLRSWPGKVVSEVEGGFKGAGAILKNIWDSNLKQVKLAFDGFKTWMDGWTNGGFSSSVDKLGAKWDTIKTKASEAFEGIKGLWSSLVSFVENLVPTFNWPDPLKWLKDTYSVPGAPPGMVAPPTDANGNITGPAPEPSGGEKQGMAPFGRAPKFAASSGFAPSIGAGRQMIGGQIVVSAAPGSQVESVQSTNSAVPLTTDRGRVVGRV